MLRTLTVAVGIVAVSFTTSCAAKARNRQLNSSVQKSEITVNANQIRLRMRSLVDPFAGEIEESADRIIANTSTTSVKRAAIKWKIEGVPELRGALFQPDPFTAVLDTWIFTFQMADYFDTGPGRVSLGDAAPIAVDTSRRLEAEVNRVTSTFTTPANVSVVRDFSRKWASEHPIRYSIQDRETALSRITDVDVGVSWSVGEAVAELTTTADDIHREIQIYSDHLFRQARWEADLLKLDLHTEEVLPLAERAVKSSERAVMTLDSAGGTIDKAVVTLDRAVVTLDSLVPAIKSMADTASNAPALVTSERKAAIEAVHADLTQTLIFLQGERIASLKQVSEERIAALRALTEERVAALAELREIAANERAALSRDIEQSTLKLVDHAAWRITQLVVGACGFLVVAAMLLLLAIRRLFFSPHEPQYWLHRGIPGKT
jgi:hypothetical protein